MMTSPTHTEAAPQGQRAAKMNAIARAGLQDRQAAEQEQTLENDILTGMVENVRKAKGSKTKEKVPLRDRLEAFYRVTAQRG